MFLQINGLISKGMSNIDYWEKNISQKENLKKCSSFKEQKGTRYIQQNVYFVKCCYCLQLSFVHKSMSQISFNLFCMGDRAAVSWKVWSLFSMRIFKNMMNNYTWTLIIWWKRKIYTCKHDKIYTCKHVLFCNSILTSWSILMLRID